MTTKLLRVPGTMATERVAGVEELARRRLAENCPYAFYFRDISYELNDGLLILRGRVPTFYLKQVLQTFLRGLSGVTRIDNRVDVVSSTGLSSIRPW